MPKALTIAGMAIAGLLVLLFGLDLAVGFPFGKSNLLADILILVAAGSLGYLSFSTYREVA